MQIKRLDIHSYEIRTSSNCNYCNYIIYAVKEKNPGTKEAIGKQLYLYFVDVFNNKDVAESRLESTIDSEVFDEKIELIEYLENNYDIPGKVIQQIKFR